MAKAKSPPQIYQIKVTLRNSKPPIWRRLLVSDDTTLPTLHQILQTVMAWNGGHLHQFKTNEKYYVDPEYRDDLFADDETASEERVRISRIAPTEGAKFIYEYDFGDSWEHIILVEKILPFDAEQTLPQCIKGKRAAPPDDVGGIWGYYFFLEALADPNHPDYEMYSEWVDEDFDPEAFDMDAVNAELRRLG